MELFWWFLTIVLFAVGLIGTIAPVLPGTTIILAAAIIHRIMLGPDKSIGWHTIIVSGAANARDLRVRCSRLVISARNISAQRNGERFGAILGTLVGSVFRPDWPVRWSGDWRGHR